MPKAKIKSVRSSIISEHIFMQESWNCPQLFQERDPQYPSRNVSCLSSCCWLIAIKPHVDTYQRGFLRIDIFNDHPQRQLQNILMQIRSVREISSVYLEKRDCGNTSMPDPKTNKDNPL